VQNVGADECEIVGVLDASMYSESSLSDWIAKAPRHVLANNLGVPAESFAAATNRSVIVAAI
jgi:oxalate decarboxylase